MAENVRIIKKQSSELDVEYVTKLAEEFKKSKAFEEEVAKRTSAMKAELNKIVQENGIEDDKGHIWLEIGDLKLKRERRVQRTLDTESASNWAKQNGHWDDVKEIIEVLDEDKLLGLAWSNEEVAEKVQSFYVEKETWAFKA